MKPRGPRGPQPKPQPMPPKGPYGHCYYPYYPYYYDWPYDYDWYDYDYYDYDDEYLYGVKQEAFQQGVKHGMRLANSQNVKPPVVNPTPMPGPTPMPMPIAKVDGE